jgi:hypothetical protein
VKGLKDDKLVGEVVEASTIQLFNHSTFSTLSYSLTNFTLPLHIPPILPTHLVQRVRDLPKGAVFGGFHERRERILEK